MIKKIIQLADIHIRPYKRLEEYAEYLELLKGAIAKEVEGYDRSEIRVVVCGDLADSKLVISNELILFLSTWIRELEKFGEVIAISGNHDLLVNNKSRVDTLTALFKTAAFENSIHLDSYLGYESGVIAEDNVTWALFSIFSDYRRPNIEQARQDFPSNTVIGLYHGTIVGASLDNGNVMSDGTNGDDFYGCDFVLAGDIHKRQVLKRGDVIIVYPGSLIQQTFGETVTQHGFASWNVETKEYKFIDLPIKYGLFDFSIKTPEDIDEDKELLLNY